MDKSQVIRNAKRAAKMLDQSDVAMKTKYLTVIDGKGRVETWFDSTSGVRLWTTQRKDINGHAHHAESENTVSRDCAEQDHFYSVVHFDDGGS